jgi:hypothetical protein
MTSLELWGNGERSDQDGMDHAVDDGGRAGSQRQRGDHDGRERRLPQERPHGVPEILQERAHA